MKKQLAVLAAIVVTYSPLANAFQRTQILEGADRITATVTTGGTKDASFTANVRDAANPDNGVDVAAITWPNALPQSGWQRAAQVIRLQFSVTDLNGGIQIYTDNTSAGASPRFVDPTPNDNSNADSNPAGMLLGTQGDTSTTIPLAWSAKPVSDANQAPTAANPNHNGLNGQPTDPNAFQWFFMSDHETPAIGGNNAFTDGAEFHRVAGSQGVHVVQVGTYAADADNVAYIYLQADLSSTSAQATYQTSTITLEAYIE